MTPVVAMATLVRRGWICLGVREAPYRAGRPLPKPVRGRGRRRVRRDRRRLSAVRDRVHPHGRRVGDRREAEGRPLLRGRDRPRACRGSRPTRPGARSRPAGWGRFRPTPQDHPGAVLRGHQRAARAAAEAARDASPLATAGTWAKRARWRGGPCARRRKGMASVQADRKAQPTDRVQCPGCRRPTSPFRRDRGACATDCHYVCGSCGRRWTRWSTKREKNGQGGGRHAG